MKPVLKKILLSLFSFIFIIMTIGFGHIFMITIEHFDMKISADEYSFPGREASLHGDTTLEEELEKMVLKSRSIGSEAKEKIFSEACENLKTAGTFSFRTLPLSDFLIFCTFLSFLTGLAILVSSKYMKNHTSQTVAGIFSGLFLWITSELGLVSASRQLGIAKRFDIFNGSIIGIRGEYVLLKYSWVFVLLVLLYLLFQESVRCNMLVFIRRKLHLMRGATATGRIDNYGPRVAFFYTSSIWTFYVLLLLAYDESIFGVRSWFTFLLFFFCLTCTGYLFYKLVHQGSLGAKLRYSIGVALVFWSDLEILEKWWGTGGPWHSYNLVSLVFFVLAIIAGTILVYFEIKKKRAASNQQ